MKKDFILFRSQLGELAERYQLKNPSLMILDPFQNPVAGPFNPLSSINKDFLDQHTKNYKNQEPDWQALNIDEFIKNSPGKKVVLCAFLEDGGKNSELTVKTVSDKMFTYLRNEVTFIKIDYKEDKIQSKQWRANREGSIVVLRVKGEKKFDIVKSYSTVPSISALYSILDKELKKIPKSKKKSEEKKTKPVTAKE
ncbi:MAG: hypothetical protein HY606_14570 [Planctomycetes bacterium]|nr:hypothetical protein [Planctomycetota bacterium]